MQEFERARFIAVINFKLDFKHCDPGTLHSLFVPEKTMERLFVFLVANYSVRTSFVRKRYAAKFLLVINAFLDFEKKIGVKLIFFAFSPSVEMSMISHSACESMKRLTFFPRFLTH